MYVGATYDLVGIISKYLLYHRISNVFSNTNKVTFNLTAIRGDISVCLLITNRFIPLGTNKLTREGRGGGNIWSDSSDAFKRNKLV